MDDDNDKTSDIESDKMPDLGSSDSDDDDEEDITPIADLIRPKDIDFACNFVIR